MILDGTIVTVALPSIQADLGFTADSLSWVMTTYLIAFGGLLLLSGRLGDLLGRKRMFLAGIAVFVAASLACGLAAGPGMLIAARFVQGQGRRWHPPSPSAWSSGCSTARPTRAGRSARSPSPGPWARPPG
jgi:MFS family permease